MAEVTVIVCDECGKQKQTCNHWFVALRAGQILSLVPIDAIGNGVAAKHLCGQSCVHSLIDRWMTTGDLSK